MAERQGERRINGGRRGPAICSIWPALGAATHHNPVVKAYYDRLRAKGKKAKVALVACMRKLIGILNIMMARGQKWNPTRYAAQLSERAPARSVPDRAHDSQSDR